jgi:DNA-directed RNA polymerase specialized sigma24 family protein
MDPVKVELSRALRRRPAFSPWAEDLYQDGWEAIYRYEAVGDIRRERIAARGAILRSGLRYLGVTEKTGFTPQFTDIFGYEAAKGPEANELEVYDLQKYLLSRTKEKHGDRGVRVLEARIEGVSGSQVAKEYGVTREAVRQWLEKVINDAKEWYREAA